MKPFVSTFLVLALTVSLLGGVFASGAAGESLGSWNVGAPAPTKRTEVAVAAVKDKIYVVGGFTEPDFGNFFGLCH